MMSLKKRLSLFWLACFMMFCFALQLIAQTPEDNLANGKIKFISDLEYLASNLRDPLETYIVPKPPEPSVEGNPEEPPPDPEKFNKLKVSGIFWGASFTQAIIDGNVYKEGDRIEGAVIKKIDKDGIIVLAGGKEFKLVPPALTKTSDEKKPRGGER
jgi:type II secretory pathway component PulC